MGHFIFLFYSANLISKYLTNHHFALKQFYFLHVCLIYSYQMGKTFEEIQAELIIFLNHKTIK